MHASRKDACHDREFGTDRAENKRIQRLLLSEYWDFSDTILVESPFAETTRNGHGIRQVALGLTPSRLIVAADVLKDKFDEFLCPIDPSIANFELVSVYPLEYVTLSIFRRRRRKSLKARFIDGRTRYYELGGIRGGKIYWNVWCEQVRRLLEEKIDGSSLSETTAASSSSSSTFYALSSGLDSRKRNADYGEDSVYRIWAHCGGAGDCLPRTWTRKDLYLGPTYEELTNGQYAPVPVRFAGASFEDVRRELKDYSPNVASVDKPCRSWPMYRVFASGNNLRNSGGPCDVLYFREHRYSRTCDANTCCQNPSCVDCEFEASARFGVPEAEDACREEVSGIYTKDVHGGRCDDQNPRDDNLTRKVSRFGFGVPEKCSSGLVLGPLRRDPAYRVERRSKCRSAELYEFVESGVRVWEGEGKGKCKSSRRYEHFRRYGLCTAAHFLHALGPWSVQPGERDSAQRTRSRSLVNIRRQRAEPELKLPVSRRQLTSHVSYTDLGSIMHGSIGTAAKGPVILFWTPDYWYRPRPAAAAYKELREHLRLLAEFRREKEYRVKRKLFCKRGKSNGDYREEEMNLEGRPSLLVRIFSRNGNCTKRKKSRAEEEEKHGGVAQLKRLLRMNFRITVWDLNSTTLATQLTLIDRDLFLRIPLEEIEILVLQRTSRNTPNLGAWIAFGHRISCLTASEILAIRNVAMRARIIARYINAAHKCFVMGNFHSCRSILAGLQTPPIYRLRASWSYLRIHHAHRYEIMEKLSKIYKNPGTLGYRKFWIKAERRPPCMPCVADVLIRILELNELNSLQKSVAYSCAKNEVHNKSCDEKTTRLSINSEGLRYDRDEDLPIAKPCLGKRLLVATLAKIGFQKNYSARPGERGASWSFGQRVLAQKFFTRWSNIVLTSKTGQREKSMQVDSRRRRILNLVSWLRDCQRYAQAYNFARSSLAHEFLLKARYREDRENFFYSLKLERPNARTLENRSMENLNGRSRI
ncbi:hypothetical protein KM043_000799 [Ampulex compressa]|nr:hypothetical protein KM043_000799 [Ampulex compressa]